MSDPKTPRCRACGSERINFVYRTEMDDHQINEEHTLMAATGYLADYLSEMAAGNNDSRNAANAVLLADLLTRITIMWGVREEMENEEGEREDQAEEARS